MTDYTDYEESVSFQGSFEGETIITKALIYSGGNIQLHQGPKTGDNQFQPDDIIGLDIDELEEIVEKTRELERGENIDCC